MKQSLFFRGCVHPPSDIGEDDKDERHLKANNFRDSDVRKLELSGVPLTWEHDDGMCVGRVLESYTSEDGSKFILGEVEVDTLQGALTAKDMESGKLGELSLSHKFQQFVQSNGDGKQTVVQRRTPIRVGITEKGLRNGCVIEAASLRRGPSSQQQGRPILSVEHNSAKSRRMAESEDTKMDEKNQKSNEGDISIVEQMADGDVWKGQDLAAEQYASLSTSLAQKYLVIEKQNALMKQEFEAALEVATKAKLEAEEQHKRDLSAALSDKQKLEADHMETLKTNLGEVIKTGKDLGIAGFQDDKDPLDVLMKAYGDLNDPSALVNANRSVELFCHASAAFSRHNEERDRELEALRARVGSENSKFERLQKKIHDVSAGSAPLDSTSARFDMGAPPVKEEEADASADGTKEPPQKRKRADWANQMEELLNES